MTVITAFTMKKLVCILKITTKMLFFYILFGKDMAFSTDKLD